LFLLKPAEAKPSEIDINRLNEEELEFLLRILEKALAIEPKVNQNLFLPAPEVPG
jgi:hypothetical protein